MERLNSENVPEHLKGGELFNNLPFEIETRYFKKDLIVSSKEDFIWLIDTFKHWKSKNVELPLDTIGEFIMKRNVIKPILEEKEMMEYFKFMSLDFDSIFKSAKIFF